MTSCARGVRPVPEAARAAQPPGRLSVGRRAADADGRAHLDGRPRAVVARRAVGGAGAAHRRVAARQCPRAEGRRRHDPDGRAGVDFSLALADRVYILEKGSIRHTGPAVLKTLKGSLVDCSEKFRVSRLMTATPPSTP